MYFDNGDDKMSRLKDILKIRMKKLNESTDLYELVKTGGHGKIPTFVEGLILSSLLIEEIKLDLSPEYSVMRGQAIKNDGNLSKEIDVIIFSGKPYYEWQNIGYAIIPSKQIKAVLEVNTWFGSGVSRQDEYKDLYEQLEPFSSKVFLFCFHDDVSDAKINEHKKLLMSFGYEDVFIFKRDDVLLENEWYRFVQTIRQL